MGIVMDSSVIIDWERGALDLQARIEKREDELFFLSVITASELLHGVHRARDRRIRSRRAAMVEGVLTSFPILPIDLTTARLHAQLWAGLQSAGTMIGAHDLWLAATCIAHGHALVTGNVREFARVPGLFVECWSAE